MRKSAYSTHETAATLAARIVQEGKWFIAWSPEFPEGNDLKTPVNHLIYRKSNGAE
ncbi:MAG: hypothetical protein ABI600_12595 [Luteolibacter sp.]